MKVIYFHFRSLIIASFFIFLSGLAIYNYNNLTKEVFLTITSNEELQQVLNSDKKIVYLTFDDGPTEKMTPKILDILKAENVPATFFVVGKHVKESPDIVKRAFDEGHYIANHSYSHSDKKLYESIDSFIKEILDTDIEIGKALNIKNYSSNVFRFPEGYMTKRYHAQKEEATEALKELNYEYVDWNCLNKDSEKKCSNQQLINNLIKTSKGKTALVVLMHDTGDVNETDKVLKESITYFKKQGYEFRNFYDFYE